MAIISDDDDLEKRGKYGGNKKNPIVKPETIEYDNTFESSIRPKDFDSYIGQGALKETLKITLEAAKKTLQASGSYVILRTSGLGKNNNCGGYCFADGS